MDLETLLNKPVNELTIGEVRFLQSNISDFAEKYDTFQNLYSDFSVSDYKSIVINDSEIIINGDISQAIETDSVFKNYLINVILQSLVQREKDNKLLEIELAKRILTLLENGS